MCLPLSANQDLKGANYGEENNIFKEMNLTFRTQTDDWIRFKTSEMGLKISYKALKNRDDQREDCDACEDVIQSEKSVVISLTAIYAFLIRTLVW